MLKKISQPIFILFFIFLQQGCNAPEASPYPSPVWEQKTDFPLEGRSSAAVAVANNKAYIFFGRNKNTIGSYQNDCWEYDAADDSWEQKSSCPGEARVKAIAVNYNNKIYTGLGYNGKGLYNQSNYLKDFWTYDPEKDEWKQLKNVPLATTNACNAFVYKNEIYVGMGYNSISLGEEWWKYSPETDEWTQLKNFPDLSRYCCVVCYNEEHIFLGGGYHSGTWNEWWEYSPINDSWKKLKNMPNNGIVNGVGLCVNDRFFIATGRYFKGSLSGGGVKSNIFEYDQNRNTWYDHGDIPGAARENAIAFTINGKAYIGLGENDHNTLNDLMCFNP